MWHSPQKSHHTSAPPSPLRVSWRMTSSSAARPSSPPETWRSLGEGTQYARYHQTGVRSAKLIYLQPHDNGDITWQQKLRHYRLAHPLFNLNVIKGRTKRRYVMFGLIYFVIKHSPTEFEACDNCPGVVYHCVTSEFLLTTLASILKVRMLSVFVWKVEFCPVPDGHMTSVPQV